MRLLLLILALISIYIPSTLVIALTPKAQKGVKTLQSIGIEHSSPKRFTPFTDIDRAPEEIDYRTSLLPYPEDRKENIYIVLPTLGLVAPVLSVQTWTQDYKDMTTGKEIEINNYLNEGVMFYPKTGKIGQTGNPVIFGHSNFYRTGKGKYKTIFADIMNLDTGQQDEIWIYTKNLADGSYDLYKYRITQSFETNPENVSILKPLGGKEITVFACTNGLAGRWILKGKLIAQDDMLIKNTMRTYIDRVLVTLKKMGTQTRQDRITRIMVYTQQKKDALPASMNYKMKYRKYVIEYIEKRLIDIY